MSATWCGEPPSVLWWPWRSTRSAGEVQTSRNRTTVAPARISSQRQPTFQADPLVEGRPTGHCGGCGPGQWRRRPPGGAARRDPPAGWRPALWQVVIGESWAPGQSRARPGLGGSTGKWVTTSRPASWLFAVASCAGWEELQIDERRARWPCMAHNRRIPTTKRPMSLSSRVAD